MIGALTSPANAGSLLIAAILLMGCAVLLFGIVLQGLLSHRARGLQERLALIMPARDGGETTLVFAHKAGEQPGGGSLADRLRRWHGRVGGWPALRLVLPLSVGGGAVVGGLAYFVFLSGLAVAFSAALAVGLMLLRRQLKQAETRRRVTFLEHLPEAIDLIVRVVQAGIPVTEAIAVAGREAAEPVAAEFRDIAQRVQLGVDLKEVLLEAAERVDVLDFDCFVVSLIVQRETGGQISETLQNLAAIVRRRKETRAKAKVLTAEGRLTAKVIAGLPFFVGGALALLNPTYMGVLIDHPTGRKMLLVALGCMALGMAVIENLTRAEA